MEQRSASRSWFRLDDPAAAALVIDNASRRYLEPLMEAERTVAELARSLAVHPSSVMYRLRQFLAHGLVEVARVEARRGRAIKHYRSAADGFFVPFEVTPYESQEVIASGAFRELQQVLERSIGEAWTEAAGDRRPLGLHFYHGVNGTSFDLAPETAGTPPRQFFSQLLADGEPAVWDSSARLSLSRTQAKELQRELAGLLARYRAAGDESAPGEYLVRLALAPLRPSTPTNQPR